MKKNALLTLLQNIKGNPDIKFWNSLVDDWMDITIDEFEFVKETEDFIRSGVELRWQRDNKTWDIPPDIQAQLNETIKRITKAREWEFPNPFVSVEEEKLWYGKNRKKVLLIQGKLRGKKTWDRLGDIRY